MGNCLISTCLGQVSKRDGKRQLNLYSGIAVNKPGGNFGSSYHEKPA